MRLFPRTALAAPAILTFLAGCAFAPQFISAPDRENDPVTTSKTISIGPNAGSDAKFAKLAFRGGIEFSSTDERVGGISGLILKDNGREFLGVTDAGYWVKGRLAYDKGRLAKLSISEVAAMMDPEGNNIVGKKLGDAESIIGKPDGKVLVSFERKHRIWAYDLSDGLDNAKASPQSAPKDLINAKTNGGLEAIVRLSEGGSLLAITESTLNTENHLKGWLESDGGWKDISLKQIKPYQLTDLARLPSGDLLTLERRYSPIGGVGILLRRIDQSKIKPGAVLTGDVLLELDMDYAIDNMEGLTVRKDKAGRTFVYLVSDNNFNPLQRNLMLMFELLPQ